MVSGRMMAFISARAFGKDEDAGVGEAGWERADEGFVVKTMMRVAAGASWALRPRWEDEGGGASRRRDDIFFHKWVDLPSTQTLPLLRGYPYGVST